MSGGALVLPEFTTSNSEHLYMLPSVGGKLMPHLWSEVGPFGADADEFQAPVRPRCIWSRNSPTSSSAECFRVKEQESTND